MIHKVKARIDLLFEEYMDVFGSVLLGESSLIIVVLLNGFVFKYDKDCSHIYEKLNFMVLFKNTCLKISLFQVGVFF